jgi:adenylate cyclase
MAREIERKFLVVSEDWRTVVSHSCEMRQGYVASSEKASVRVRIEGDEGKLNIKSGGLVASRAEFEYAIPVADAHELLALTSGRIVEKTRHYVFFGGFEWEIDEFAGDNRGLIVVELELDSEDQPFERPAWLGKEVTHLRRYYNVCLVDHPFSVWTAAEKNP